MLPGLKVLLDKYDKGTRKERVVKGHDYNDRLQNLSSIKKEVSEEQGKV